MVKLLAACAAGVMCLASCANTTGLPTPSPSGHADAGSAAAGLRARMVLLTGEHTYVIAKLAVAAAEGRKDEYAAYASLLILVSDDLSTQLGRSIGETQGAKFRTAWLLGDSFFVDYMVAATTRQQDMADAAMVNLTNTYVPQTALAISSPLNISMSTATRLMSDNLAATKQLIDDAAAGTPTAFYNDARGGYTKSTAMGGALAEGVAWKFPDKYPGDAAGSGARLRAQLDAAMQEHAYLLSMATDAAATGATTDAGSAAGVLQANLDDMSRAIAAVFGSQAGSQAVQLWGDEDRSFMAYAAAGDDSARTTALSRLNQSSTPALKAFLSGLQVTADVAAVTHQTIGVIDDQRAKSYGVIAAEDRESAALLVSIGDLMLGVPGG